MRFTHPHDIVELQVWQHVKIIHVQDRAEAENKGTLSIAESFFATNFTNEHEL